MAIMPALVHYCSLLQVLTEQACRAMACLSATTGCCTTPPANLGCGAYLW